MAKKKVKIGHLENILVEIQCCLFCCRMSFDPAKASANVQKWGEGRDFCQSLLSAATLCGHQKSALEGWRTLYNSLEDRISERQGVSEISLPIS